MRAPAQQSEFLKRLRQYCESRKISVHRFEMSCGLSNAWASNLQTQIRLDAVDTIARNFPELNIVWLLTGRGNMLNPATAQRQLELLKAKDETIAAQKVAIEGYHKMLEILAKK